MAQIHSPRLSYLPFLLPRLSTFFHTARIDPGSNIGWFSYEGVPLRWHWPVGLLYDLFSGAQGVTVSGRQVREGGRAGNEGLDENEGVGRASGESVGKETLPWRLEVHFEEWPEDQLVRLDDEGKVMHDAFINAVKEADFLRNGTAKGIMSLSKDDSTKLWNAVETHDITSFMSINQKLLDPPGAKLRHVPLKVYLPSSASSAEQNISPSAGGEAASPPAAASLRIVQSLVTPSLTTRNETQTLGAALHTLLPTLFPSRRTPTLARPVLHGAVVPFTAPVEELMRAAAYADGWLHLGVVMMG
ncbi:MAG: hypothetical protein M4579_003779 [Chaenotheca gracillima]|nr:MAG: hypothetical protein M4579_003779 [Chaenotheca gracillima]